MCFPCRMDHAHTQHTLLSTALGMPFGRTKVTSNGPCSLFSAVPAKASTTSKACIQPRAPEHGWDFLTFLSPALAPPGQSGDMMWKTRHTKRQGAASQACHRMKLYKEIENLIKAWALISPQHSSRWQRERAEGKEIHFEHLSQSCATRGLSREYPRSFSFVERQNAREQFSCRPKACVCQKSLRLSRWASARHSCFLTLNPTGSLCRLSLQNWSLFRV